MRGQNRKCYKGVLNHSYQRTKGGEILFYSTEDHLVFFTIFCVTASHYPIQILKLCQMPDHIHSSVIVERRSDLSAFVHDYTTCFARENNRTCHRTGPLFQSPFGSVPKFGEKKVKSNLVYVDNNPVERKLCVRAEQYPWNFVAYATSDHPFSEPFLISKATKEMKRAVKEVKARHASGQYLPYRVLRRLFKHLSLKEQNQLTDIIVSIYSVIDHQAAIRQFGSYEEMLIADHSTTGGEYEMDEVFIGKDDSWYNRMTTILLRELNLDDIHDILGLPIDKKYDLYLLLREKTMAPGPQIAKYLRMPLQKADKKLSDT